MRHLAECERRLSQNRRDVTPNKGKRPRSPASELDAGRCLQYWDHEVL